MDMKLQEYCEYRLTGLFLDGHTAKPMKLNEYEILIYDPKDGDAELVKMLCEKYNHIEFIEKKLRPNMCLKNKYYRVFSMR